MSDKSIENQEQTSRIVSAYVRTHHMPAKEVPDMIKNIHEALVQLTLGAIPVIEAEEEPPVIKEPAVPISQSIQDEFLVCLEDGLKFKTLKRHLRARYGLTPDQYRRKWNLPQDYPMVSPNYSKLRRDIVTN